MDHDESAIGVAFVGRHQGGTSRFIVDRPEVCLSLSTRCEKNNIPQVKLSAPLHMTRTHECSGPMPPGRVRQEESPKTSSMCVSLVQGSMRCDHLHIAMESILAHVGFCQSETPGVTIERETTEWPVGRSQEVAKRCDRQYDIE